MRNAAGERSDGLHLLGARDLFHQPSPLGHVLDDSGIAAAIGHATQQCNDALIRRGQQLSFEVLHGQRRPHHFDELARFYPEFKNLKSLLYAIDLRAMVNLKL